MSWMAKHIAFNPSHFFKNILLNPPLTAIAIEINSSCNRKCRFCPNLNHTRLAAFLDEELFHKIVNDLVTMGFKGTFAFNMYNEPLLDNRLSEFIGHVRKELPCAYMCLNTNGDLLSLALWKKFRELGLDFTNITQYDGKINKNIREILDKLNPSEKKHINAHTLDYICSRAGLVATGQNANPFVNSPCQRPFCQLSVNYRGKAVLCCNDYLGSVEIGDLYRKSVADIWKSEVFRHYRKELFFKGRAHLKLCESCDEKIGW